MEDLKKAMIKKTSKYKSSSGFKNSVTDSFQIDTPRRKETSSTLRLRNLAPHGRALEEGVKCHPLPTHIYYDRDKWSRWIHWMDTHGFTKENSPLYILVGGPFSSIQKGNSKRQFFNITIDEFQTLGKFDKIFNKAIEQADKKSR